MTDIKWGHAIAVDGKRPSWLGDEQRFMLKAHDADSHGTWNGEHTIWRGREWRDHYKISAIRLPADHPHYRQTEAAIPEGMKPWHGGNSAPADWDGKAVAFRDGKIGYAPVGAVWKLGWDHSYGGGDIIAYTSEATAQPAPIDWSGELEAVHEDGRTMPASSSASGMLGGKRVQWKYWPQNAGWIDYDTGLSADHPGWRIRNVPQSTPQADTKPDLTAEEQALELARMVAEWPVQMFVYNDTLNKMNEARQKARGIVALLPEPVDPDEAEAQRLNDDSPYDLTGLDEQHAARNVRYIHATILAAIKRGRALALAGEKEA